MMEQKERPFWNPYLAGFALGLVLLASFLVAGQGLGASGAANRLSIGALSLVAPGAVQGSYFGNFVGPGKRVLDDWLVFEVLGVVLGGVLGAWSAGRMRLGIQKGPNMHSIGLRLGLALTGGMLMGVAARLARGCTSGQALTGGSALAFGSWIFMFAVFGGGYLLAPMIRRTWR
jgi:uncharacterized protein